MTGGNETVLAADLPQFHSLLNSLKTFLTESITGVTNLQNMVVDTGRSREHGLSFLEMKCHFFLEYLINITYSMLLKVDGKPICGEACIEHLVEIRTVLSKIKPIEKKLKYQIDKLIKMSSNDGLISEQHALSFKPNLENLVGKDEGSDDDDKEEEKTGTYIPPKLIAVPYKGDRSSREERKLEKARKRNLNSNLLADIREEFGDEPEEISDTRNRSMQRKLKEREDERQRYEEDNLCRLTMTRKDKLMKRKMSVIDEVVKIGKFTGGDDEDSDIESEFKPKMKKRKREINGGKGKFKKRMQRKQK